MKKIVASIAILALGIVVAGCEPEVGSDRWCEKMADAPKSDWSVNDARSFAQHCIFKEYDDEEDEEEQ